jgi:hypothetical protein
MITNPRTIICFNFDYLGIKIVYSTSKSPLRKLTEEKNVFVNILWNSQAKVPNIYIKLTSKKENKVATC